MQPPSADTRAVDCARLDLPDMKFIYTDWHRQLGERLRKARLDARHRLAIARVPADVLAELGMFYGLGCAVAARRHPGTGLKSVLEPLSVPAVALHGRTRRFRHLYLYTSVRHHT